MYDKYWLFVFLRVLCCRPSKHYMYEGAQRMLKAGFTSFKFNLQPGMDCTVLRAAPLFMAELAVQTTEFTPPTQLVPSAHADVVNINGCQTQCVWPARHTAGTV